MTENEAPAEPVEVPVEALSADALDGIIDNFILREGTDYGAQEVSYATRVEQVRRKLERGEVKIVFDPNTESVTLLVSEAVRGLGTSGPFAPHKP